MAAPLLEPPDEEPELPTPELDPSSAPAGFFAGAWAFVTAVFLAIAGGVLRMFGVQRQHTTRLAALEARQAAIDGLPAELARVTQKLDDEAAANASFRREVRAFLHRRALRRYLDDDGDDEAGG